MIHVVIVWKDKKQNSNSLVTTWPYEGRFNHPILNWHNLLTFIYTNHFEAVLEIMYIRNIGNSKS